MVTHTVFKTYSSAEFAEKWGNHAWQETPAEMITLPFPGGVLIGALSQDRAQRVSFFLTPEGAAIIGARLIAAAEEADE